MNRSLEIANQYYEAILKYENYIDKYGKPYSNEIYLVNKKNISIEMIDTLNDYNESIYMPWKKIKGNVRDNLAKIFFLRDEETMPYLRACDGIGDLLTDLGELELSQYYQSQGFDIKEDKLMIKIVDEAVELHFCEVLDPNIYSEKIVELHAVARNFDKVCNELLEFYQRSYVNDCIDYPILKGNLNQNELKKIDNVLRDFCNYQSKYDDGEVDIVEQYTSKYGNSNIIYWYEGIKDTESFIEDLKLEENQFKNFETNNRFFDMVTPLENINNEDSFTVARVIDDKYCVELHYYKEKSTIEYGTKVNENKWENNVEEIDWFDKNMSEEEISKKLNSLFENYYGVDNGNEL